MSIAVILLFAISLIDGNFVFAAACRANDPPVYSVSLASTSTRLTLRNTVDSLVRQVHRMYIYLNDYPEVPEWLSHHTYADKFTVYPAKVNLMDNGKAYFLREVDRGYHFTCDDDIVYPANYVESMITVLSRHKNKVIVGVHAINMTSAFRTNESLGYYDRHSRNVSHFERSLARESRAHILGTGTVAFHVDLMAKLSMTDFPVPGMMDIWLAVYAARQSIPMIAIQRDSFWLQELKPEDSIWTRGQRNDTLQTRVVREMLLPYI